MLKAIEFKGFIAPERASSMCFRVAVDDEREWVVRAKKSGYNAKRLFKEYFFAGVLALEYGLSRPAVTTISIDDSVRLASIRARNSSSSKRPSLYTASLYLILIPQRCNAGIISVEGSTLIPRSP